MDAARGLTQDAVERSKRSVTQVKGRMRWALVPLLAGGLLAACGGPAAKSAPKGPQPVSQANPARSSAPQVTAHYCTPSGVKAACWGKATFQSVATNMAGAMPSGFSASFAAVWDAKDLFLLEKVKTPKGIASTLDPTAPWTTDAMEAYLSGSNSSGTTMGTHEVQFVVPAAQPASIWHTSGRTVSGVLATVAKTGSGYDTLLTVPWTVLGTSAGTGQRIGVNVAADAYSGKGQNQLLAWGIHGSNEQAPAGWGQLTLAK